MFIICVCPIIHTRVGYVFVVILKVELRHQVKHCTDC